MHRAQGCWFPLVVADMDTGQGQTNEGYFRWVYTLFALAPRQLVLLNAPSITPLSGARWDESQCRIEPVRHASSFTYARNDVARDRLPGQEQGLPEALHHLYVHVSSVLAGIGARIETVEHLAYQERYTIHGAAGASCQLNVIFNGKHDVTSAQVIHATPADFGATVVKTLTAQVSTETPFQRLLYDTLRPHLEASGITVVSLAHQAFHEVYTLSSQVGVTRVRLDYDKQGFVTRVAPVAAGDAAVLAAVRTCMEAAGVAC